MSKTRQDSVASSIPEADIVAADTVLQHMRVPSLDIWDRLLQKGGKQRTGVLREDNDACMKVIQSGRKPTMRRLHRVHGVRIRVLHEIAGARQTILFCGCCLHPPPMT